MYNILDFGAKQKTLCTQYIQNAIDKCAKNGGGIVTIPAGLYICGTIYLRDNVELNLQTGAVLKASIDMSDYNDEDAYEQNWGSQNEKWRGKHLIVALECKNVAITGDGIIDGSGDSFFGTERNFVDSYAWEGGYITSKDLNILRPGQLICFIECENIKVKDINIKNAPCWSLYLYGCTVAGIRGITVTNPFECVNTDGIDLDCCQNVTVSDCIITTGDDAIAIRCSDKRLKKYRVCENITVTGCVLASNSAAFRIGVGTGEIRHVVITGIVVSRAGHLLSFNTSFDGRGNANISDVIFRDVSANNVGGVIDGYIFKGALKNIFAENIHANSKGGIIFLQNNPGILSDVTLKNIQISITDRNKQRDEHLVRIVNTTNVTLDSVNIAYTPDKNEQLLHQTGNENLKITNCNF